MTHSSFDVILWETTSISQKKWRRRGEAQTRKKWDQTVMTISLQHAPICAQESGLPHSRPGLTAIRAPPSPAHPSPTWRQLQAGGVHTVNTSGGKRPKPLFASLIQMVCRCAQMIRALESDTTCRVPSTTFPLPTARVVLQKTSHTPLQQQQHAARHTTIVAYSNLRPFPHHPKTRTCPWTSFLAGFTMPWG